MKELIVIAAAILLIVNGMLPLALLLIILYLWF